MKGLLNKNGHCPGFSLKTVVLVGQEALHFHRGHAAIKTPNSSFGGLTK